MAMRYTYFSCRGLCLAIDFLIDSIYVRFGSSVFRQVIGIPMAPIVPLWWLISSLIPSSTISWWKQWNRTLQKLSSSATSLGTWIIYSALAMWTMEITSAQFTRRNCSLRTLPHHLLKCVISKQISRREVQTHLSVSSSTMREMTLHSGLSTFLIWTVTFPPIQLTVFIYPNWWDMLEFALPKLTSWIDSAVFHYVSDNKAL